MSEAFNNVILELRAKSLEIMVEEIITYMMERWENNRMRFSNLSDGDVLLYIKRKIMRTNTYTNL